MALHLSTLRVENDKREKERERERERFRGGGGGGVRSWKQSSFDRVRNSVANYECRAALISEELAT